MVYARLAAAGVQGLRIALENHTHIRTFCRSGKEHSWEMAPKGPITQQDIEDSPAVGIAALDASLFRVQEQFVGNQRRTSFVPWCISASNKRS